MTAIHQIIFQTAITLGIGVVVIGLLKYILQREKGLLMSKEDHYRFCSDAKKDFREGIKEEFASFRAYFDVEMENKVMKSLKNLNGTLEQKIADVVSSQVGILGRELTKEINEKLDLVEVLKHLAKK